MCVVNQRFAVKFEIRLIDEHGSLRRGLRNLNQDIACDCCSSWIVGIRDGDEPGSRTELSEQVFCRKGEIVAGAHFDNARAFGLSEDRVHGESGHNDERFVPGIEIRGAEKMNRFVDSVSEQNLRRIESEKTRDFFFNRLALGIARQQVRNRASATAPARAANIPRCSR